MYDAVKEHERKTSITFGFIGDLLCVEAISNALGIRPTRSFEKGEPYVGAERSGGEIVAVGRVRPRGAWQLSTDTHVHSEQISDHAIWLIDRLEPKAEDIARLKETKLLFSRVSVRFVGSGGFSLPSSLLCRLAGLCEEIMVTCWDDENP